MVRPSETSCARDAGRRRAARVTQGLVDEREALGDAIQVQVAAIPVLGGGFVDSAGQEALSERTEGNESVFPSRL